MDHQIGALVLGCLAAAFTGYGSRELRLAYTATDLTAWRERAFVAIGSMFVAAVFAFMTAQAVQAADLPMVVIMPALAP